MRLLVNASVLSASSTRRPLIKSRTKRAFCGETRTKRACALNSISCPYAFAAGAAAAGAAAGLAAASVAAFIECPLNWRVKLNSPSLWPTMFSVTYTGINFFPLCTAMVWPTISGTTVERRDQVRSTFFSLRAFMASIRVCRYASMNGPFFVERAINPLFRAPAHDERVRALVVARLVSAGRLTPGGHRVTSARSFAFTTAVGMVHRVHGHAAIVRALAQPARTSGLTDGDVFVIGVADLPDGRHAILRHLAGLARRQLHQRIVAFLRDQLRRSTGGAHHLR